jgi:hypothetical protein
MASSLLLQRRSLAVLPAVVLCLLFPGSACGQVPVLPHIPDSLPPEIQQALQPHFSPLQARLDTLLGEGKNLNQHCGHFERGSALEQECVSLKQQWVVQRSGIQKDVEMLQAHIGMISELVAQDQKLTHDINGNLDGIRALGFSHRAEEFEEWNNLSDDAKKDFVDKVKEQAVELMADKLEDGILAGTKGIPQEKATQWIALLEKGKTKPDAVIAAIQRMTTSETRAQLAADAGIVSTFLKTGYAGWNAETREQLLNLTLDSTCEAVPAEALSVQCKLFRNEAKVLSAEVYYGAATYVARKQVDALTRLSEDQLRALAVRNNLLKDQIRDRSEVRSRIKLLLSE